MDIEVEDPQDLEEEILVVDVAVDVAAEVDHRQARSILTLLPVTGAGCVAIWPVTVPRPVICSLREVAMLALPVVSSLNLGKKAQEEEEEVGQFGSEASTSCMTRLEMNFQWTMQVNCTSPSDWNKLWPREGMRRKILMKQKTEKNLCQCSRCWSYTVFNWCKFTKRKEKEKRGGNL